MNMMDELKAKGMYMSMPPISKPTSLVLNCASLEPHLPKKKVHYVFYKCNLSLTMFHYISKDMVQDIAKDNVCFNFQTKIK